MNTLTFDFDRGRQWEADAQARLEANRRLAWRVAAGLGLLLGITSIALASLAPFRRTVPYLVKVDADNNIEVLQTFDSRQIGRQELLDKYWATTYVRAREQYNWWLVGGDYDLVSRLTDAKIRPEYTQQFQGPQAMDKVFGEATERRIKILSVAPAPTVRDQMVVRFERTTIQKGTMVEAPTTFVVTMTYRYRPKTLAPEVELIRNPMGYEVYAYRRDAEVATASPPPTLTAAPTASSTP
jgi:type IV secretion system protein VirB8